MRFLGVIFGCCFLVIALRLIELGVYQETSRAHARQASENLLPSERLDITDRHGVIMATTLDTLSLYANPREILNAGEAVKALKSVLTEVDQDDLFRALSSGRSFVWIKRKMSPREQWAVNRLGIPGLGFQPEARRVYPQGRLAAHVVGYVDIDNNGLAGIEKYFDDRLRDPAYVSEPLRLSVDIRVQHALENELGRALAKFQAKAAAGLVMDVDTGELLALASLPDFDPNFPGDAVPAAKFNRATLGVYELGSTLKIFTLAMGLEAGAFTLSNSYDATKPLRVARFLIRDDHAKRRWLSVPEVFIYSSNIGAARMAHDIGPDYQRAFLGKLGLLQRPELEIPEIGTPITPERWGEIATMTIAFGHGIAISAVQLATGVASIVNGGHRVKPTLVAGRRSPNRGVRLIKRETSLAMRALMRLSVLSGTGRQADLAGYSIGGKTGTAEKAVDGGYKSSALLASFVGVFPINDPRYLVLAIFDEPTGTAETHNFAGGGWSAAPAVREIVRRIGPILGVEPVEENDELFHDINLSLIRDRVGP